MNKTHWKKLTNPDYLGAYAFEPKQEFIATIKYVAVEKVMGSDGKKEECTVVHFTESIKPMILNVTNAKTITKLHGSPFIEDWAGKQIQLYVKKIKAFGELVEAVRVREFVPKQATAPKIICVDCGNDVKPAYKMTAEKLAEYTKQKYGKVVCADCAKKIADKTAETRTETEEEVIETGIEEGVVSENSGT